MAQGDRPDGGRQNGGDRLEGARAERDDLLVKLAEPGAASDQRSFRELSRRLKLVDSIVRSGERVELAEANLQAARELSEEVQGDEREEMREEVLRAEEELAGARSELELLLLPPDPNEGKDVIVEIRGAEGGEEGNLFAKDLYEMYLRFAERQGWKLEPLGSQPSERGGFNEVSFVLRGEGVWRRMSHEGGTHRVQRVPVTESQGRVHTSSATVVVLPETEEIELQIDPADLRVDVYRSTGPGGQSVNTTDSAVRITHIPTGTVVAMQDEKSQIQNRAKAMVVLRARLMEMERQRQEAEASKARRGQIGGGGRSEKIRTYNFKENRVTDHRIGLTLHKLDRVLMGELDELSDALLDAERARRLSGEE